MTLKEKSKCSLQTDDKRQSADEQYVSYGEKSFVKKE